MAKHEYDLVVNSDERLGALGRTGSGKSFLMTRFVASLPDYYRTIVIDTKHEMHIPGFVITSKPDLVFARFSIRYKGKTYAGAPHKIIYRPPRSRIQDSFFGKVWSKYGSPRKPNCVVYIDEAANVTTAARIGDELKNLVQAGRSVGIGVWWSAQQAVAVHNTLLSQSEKLALFRDPVESDRKKIAGVVGEVLAETAGQLQDRQFIPYGWAEVEGISTGEGADVIILELEDTETIVRRSGSRKGR